ncbi:MobF family relaxase [Streptomyces bauhiniae]|uniref:MobF family relaxase n=1 Tax=Streptomyces bauhiniae TaxID=2340725 RepID=UPI0036478B70
MISKSELRPGDGVRYLLRGVMVGDGHRPAGTALRDAQDEAGVPPGIWRGRGLDAVGLTVGDVVGERQAELLLGEGRHPDGDRIERERLQAGDDPAKARRASVLGRPIEHNGSPKTEKAKERRPWLGMDLVFRPPPTVHIAWALMGDEERRVLELCQDISVDKTLGWLGESVAQIRSGSGGKHRKPIRDGALIVAVFRHYESRAAESKPLLHDHAVVSIRARRPDGEGTWGNLSADTLLAHIVAADTLYLLYLMEEVSARLGWAWEPREVTPRRRPVMEIAGIDQRLIGWQSTRRQQIEEALFVLTAAYVEEHGHEPGERAAYGLACRAADRTRPPKRKEPRSLSELRERWRESAIAKFGADVVDRLAERARAAAAAVWARVRPVVDVVLAAVDVVAVVYVMRGTFKRHHLLAEARRYLSYVLRGQPHQPGLDETIVQTVVDDYTRPVGRGRKMTADLHALYPRDTDDRAVLRPLIRKRTAPLYARARAAAGALSARVYELRRADRLDSPRGGGGHALEQETDVAALEQTRATIEAVAKMAAKLQDGIRERAVVQDSRPQPAPSVPTPSHTQPPGVQQTPGRTPAGGLA